MWWHGCRRWVGEEYNSARGRLAKLRFSRPTKDFCYFSSMKSKVLPTQLNLNFLIQNEAKDAALYSLAVIREFYSASSRSNFTKQSEVISAMVFAPVKVIATRISLSINSKRFETPSPPAAPSA